MDKLYIKDNFILFIKRKIPLSANAINNIIVNKEIYATNNIFANKENIWPKRRKCVDIIDHNIFDIIIIR